MLRFLLFLAVLAAAVFVGWRVLELGRTTSGPPAIEAGEPAPYPAAQPDRAARPLPPAGDCAAPPEFAAAAQANAASVESLAVAPYGLDETGWSAYAILTAKTVGTRCPPNSPAFAEKLAAFEARHGLPADGIMDPGVFEALRGAWRIDRPGRGLPADGICDDLPAGARLEKAAAEESYGGKAILARPEALAAFRRMRDAARREDPTVAGDPRNLTIFSAYRSVAADAERCETEGNCDNVRRATCSPHRTGYAFDIYVGEAPGLGPASTDPASRRYLATTATYRWLVENADRFGFANYPFEPWHWEYVGPTDSAAR